MSITNLYNNEIYPLNNISFLGKVYIDQLRIVNRGDNTEVYLSSDEDGKLLVDDNDPIGGDSDIDVRPPVIDTINLANPWRLTTKYLVLTNRKDDTQSLLSVNSDGNLVVNDDELVVTETADFNGDNGIVVHPYNCSLNGLFTVSQICLFNDDGKEIVITVDDGELSFNGGILGSAPVNTVLPAVTGTDLVGSTLTSTDGTWDGSPVPDYTVEWYRYDDNTGTNPVLISGATNHTYVLQSADNGKYVRSNILATNVIDAVDAYSNYTSQVKTPVVNTVAPAITGSEVDGEILTCSAGTYTGNVVGLTYQWYRANADHSSTVAISGETGTTHVLVPDDVGKTLKCVVTCNGFYGQSVVTDSNWTGVIAVPATTNWDDFLDSLSLTHRWTLGDSLVDKGSGGINLTETTNHVTPSISLIQETAYNGARLYKSGEGSATLTGNGFYVPTDDFMIGFIIKPNSADMARSIDLLTFNNGGGKNSLRVTIDNGIIVVHEQVTGYGGDYYCYNPHTLTVNETYLVLFNQPNAGARSITWVKLSDGTIDGTTTYPSAPSGLWNGTGALYVGNGSTDGIVQDIIWRYGALNGTEKTDIISNFIAAA